MDHEASNSGIYMKVVKIGQKRKIMTFIYFKMVQIFSEQENLSIRVKVNS